MLVHHLQLHKWLHNCFQDPYLWPYRIIKIDGSRIHMGCSPRGGAEHPCAPKQLRHCHSRDLSLDELRLSDRKVECIHLEKV